MSQKFILSAEKTTKKSSHFEQEKPKKFTRKRSDRDRSFDSKRSKEDSIFSQYIKNPRQTPNAKIGLENDSSFLFLGELDTSSAFPQQFDKKPRKTMYSRTNVLRQPSRQECTLTLRIKILETQIKAKQGQCQRYKNQLDQQKDRRRKTDFERKAALKQVAAFQKQNEQLIMQIKKLTKEKEILNKQIEFLQKINYDQKTRNIQSFRQKHLQQELFKLKQRLHNQKNQKQLNFEREIAQIKHMKESAQENCRSMSSLVDVLKRNTTKLKEAIIQQQKLTKQRIVNSQEYCQLRDRFKKFIDQYKQIRLQNSSMRSLLETTQAQLVLSDSDFQGY